MSARLSHIASAQSFKRFFSPGIAVSFWLEIDSNLRLEEHTVCMRMCVCMCAVCTTTRQPQRRPCHSSGGCRGLRPRFHIATAILKAWRAKVWRGQRHSRCWEKWLILSAERTEPARQAHGEENYMSIKITQQSTLSVWPWGEKESERAR